MYEEFCRVALPTSPPRPIRAELATRRHDPAAGENRLAMQVAALLLTDTPVCILGADRAKLIERLTFIDSVAELLPYGMRGKLSASTLTSSTFRTHKLRLFFAAADRGARKPDHVVQWDQPDDAVVRHAYAREYLDLLTRGDLRDILASETKVSGFGRQEVVRMLDRLGAAKPPPKWPVYTFGTSRDPEPPTRFLPVRQDERPAVAPEAAAPAERPAVVAEAAVPAERPGPVAERRPVAAAGSSRMAGSAAEMGDIEEIFSSCLIALKHGGAELIRTGIDQLQSHVRHLTRLEHQQIADLIERYGLLRPGRSIDAGLLREFYVVLLRLAFTTPLTYAGYRRVEKRAGYQPGDPLHAPLARAMLDVGLQGAARLLVLGSMHESQLEDILREFPVSPDESVAMLADPSLDEVHARIVGNLAIWNWTRSKNSRSDRKSFQAAIDQHRLLAALQKRYASDPEFQLYLLTSILAFAYDDGLDEAAAARIFQSIPEAPTAALLGAMMKTAKRRDLPFIMRSFAAHAVTKEDFSEDNRRNFIALIHDDLDQASQASRIGRGLHRLGRFRPTSDGLWLPIAVIIATAVAIIVVFAVLRPGQ
jgi:hypothetical protein